MLANLPLSPLWLVSPGLYGVVSAVTRKSKCTLRPLVGENSLPTFTYLMPVCPILALGVGPCPPRSL